MSMSLDVPRPSDAALNAPRRRSSMSNDSALVPVDLDLDDPDLLANEYIFTQVFKVLPEHRAAFQKCLDKYLPYMLDSFGMYFYKGNAAVSFDEKDKFLYFEVNLFLITALRFTEHNYRDTNDTPRSVVDNPDFLKTHFEDIEFLDYTSRVYFQQMAKERQPIFHPDQMPKNDYKGSDCGLHWSLFSMFVHYWLIVPDVQTNFLGILYQIYAFDLAHQSWVSKYVHYFTIPGNVTFTIVFLCQFKVSDAFGEPFELTGGFIFASFLAASYVLNGFLKKSIFWGVSTAFACYILWMVAALWYFAFKTPDAPWYNPTTIASNPLIWVYVSSFVESLSHVIVPQLPPYIVGVNHWYGTWAFISSGENIWRLLSFLGSVTLSPLVSYISWPHLIGDMAIYQLLTLGYHAKFYDQYSRIALKAELTGNPAMDRLPERFKDLIHGMPGNSGTPHSRDPFAMIFRRPYRAVKKFVRKNL